MKIVGNEAERNVGGEPIATAIPAEGLDSVESSTASGCCGVGAGVGVSAAQLLCP